MLNNVNVEITLPTTGRIEIGDLYVKINEAALVAAKAIGQAILSNTLLLLLNEKRISNGGNKVSCNTSNNSRILGC